MVLLGTIINSFLLFFLFLYIVSHLPFDILMLVKKGKASYPDPSFRNFLEGLSVFIPTVIFWFYLFIAPILYFTSNILFLSVNLNPLMEIIFLVFGIAMMSLGLIIGILGRIGRNIYLSNDKPVLVQNWGHALVRHPQYLMYILCFTGLPFVTFSPYLLILLLGIPGYIFTSRIEDEALIECFGEAYIAYKKKVGGLFPKLFKK